jgi:hypothetical protein
MDAACRVYATQGACVRACACGWCALRGGMCMAADAAGPLGAPPACNGTWTPGPLGTAQCHATEAGVRAWIVVLVCVVCTLLAAAFMAWLVLRARARARQRKWARFMDGDAGSDGGDAGQA